MVNYEFLTLSFLPFLEPKFNDGIETSLELVLSIPSSLVDSVTSMPKTPSPGAVYILIVDREFLANGTVSYLWS